jgi:nitrogenase molybdenum-iron protein NifN
MQTNSEISGPLPFTSARNACKVCTPLGACVAFKGIKGCISLIHGSQGCSTYIRRYLISHYKEPVDIASTNFSADAAIFGGRKNFSQGLDNIISQYKPDVIAICSSCLSETIGEDMNLLLTEYKKNSVHKELPHFIAVSTPSYQGTHIDGFHDAVSVTVSSLTESAGENNEGNHINVFPGFLSTQDIRYIKEILEDFGIESIVFPDYSETLDNPIWKGYFKIPPGGTPVNDIKRMRSAKASIEFGNVFNKGSLIGRIKEAGQVPTAGNFLKDYCDVELFSQSIPIGINLTDKLFETLKQISGRDIPEKYQLEKGRLIDSYVDGHKYIFDKRAILYGEEDFVIGMASFLDEIGINVVLAASGGDSHLLYNIIPGIVKNNPDIIIKDGIDFETISDFAGELKPDLIIGSSKGYYISRKLNIPLIRVGFPIHDRIGGQRILHIGYRGAQQLFDTITNSLIQYKQDNSPVGYKYM